ncbi:MAG: hypothetical protein ACTTHG_07085 [Treponemataceae bacterium]
MYNYCCVKNSRLTQDLYSVLKNIPVNSTPVLFFGECGSGKEFFFRYLAELEFGKVPFVKISCNQLGRKNAFNLNFEKKTVVYFDEVFLLSPALQKNLLDCINNMQNNVLRIFLGTKENLQKKVDEGTFDANLYNRIKFLCVKIPPLRERKEDIIGFLEFFCKKFNIEFGKNITGISISAKEKLLAYYWPENIDEFESVIKLAVLRCEKKIISSSELFLDLNNNVKSDIISFVDVDQNVSLKDAVNDFKKNYIISILNGVNWNQSEASKILKIQRTYLSRLMSELKIKR